MQIAEAFRFPFEDKKWIEKIAIAAVLILTVVGSIAVLGWVVEIMRRVIRRDAELLAGWGDLGKYFVEGLKLMAIGILWMMPFIVVNSCASLFTPLAASLGGDDTTTASIAVLVTLCLTAFSLPYSLAVSFLMPPMSGVFAMGGSFSEALNPARAWKLARVNLGGFVIAWFVAALLGAAAGIVGMLLCFVGVFLTSAYSAVVSAHLYGQACREAMASQPAV